MVQQQWLPAIAVFKLFQTSAFREFLISCLESFKAGIVTKTLDDVMSEHLGLDLWSHEAYDPQVVETADDDLMKAVLSPSAFPFLDNLRSSTRIKTF